MQMQRLFTIKLYVGETIREESSLQTGTQMTINECLEQAGSSKNVRDILTTMRKLLKVDCKHMVIVIP